MHQLNRLHQQVPLQPTREYNVPPQNPPRGRVLTEQEQWDEDMNQELWEDEQRAQIEGGPPRRWGGQLADDAAKLAYVRQSGEDDTASGKARLRRLTEKQAAEQSLQRWLYAEATRNDPTASFLTAPVSPDRRVNLATPEQVNIGQETESGTEALSTPTPRGRSRRSRVPAGGRDGRPWQEVMDNPLGDNGIADSGKKRKRGDEKKGAEGSDEAKKSKKRRTIISTSTHITQTAHTAGTFASSIPAAPSPAARTATPTATESPMATDFGLLDARRRLAEAQARRDEKRRRRLEEEERKKQEEMREVEADIARVMEEEEEEDRELERIRGDDGKDGKN